MNQKQLTVTEAGRAVRVETDLPHLVSLGSGRFSTAITLHPLPEGKTSLGRDNCDICACGKGVESVHCFFTNISDVVTLHPVTADGVKVDDKQITQPLRLSQGSMICIGKSTYYRFNHPDEANNLRDEFQDIYSNGVNAAAAAELVTMKKDLTSHSQSSDNKSQMETDDRNTSKRSRDEFATKSNKEIAMEKLDAGRVKDFFREDSNADQIGKNDGESVRASDLYDNLETVQREKQLTQRRQERFAAQDFRQSFRRDFDNALDTGSRSRRSPAASFELTRLKPPTSPNYSVPTAKYTADFGDIYTETKNEKRTPSGSSADGDALAFVHSSLDDIMLGRVCLPERRSTPPRRTPDREEITGYDNVENLRSAVEDLRRSAKVYSSLRRRTNFEGRESASRPFEASTSSTTQASVASRTLPRNAVDADDKRPNEICR